MPEVPPPRLRSALAGAVAPLLLAALAAACFAPHIPMEEMDDLYRRAVRDAAVAEPGEVAELPPITPDNPHLVWRRGRVAVVAWVLDAGRFRPGHGMVLPAEIWVTPVPAVRERCRRIETGKRELNLRLEQLLGRPPGAAAGRRFVELWVEPGHLFRPCPDPEITDRRCETSFAAVTGEVAPGHRQWFERHAATAYGRPGRPWTRLGYTYDWGDPYGELGVPELVVRAGTAVLVEGVWESREYCRPE